MVPPRRASSTDSDSTLRRSTPAVCMILRAIASGISPTSVCASLPAGAPGAPPPPRPRTGEGAPVPPHAARVEGGVGAAAAGELAHGGRHIIGGAHVDRLDAVVGGALQAVG